MWNLLIGFLWAVVGISWMFWRNRDECATLSDLPVTLLISAVWPVLIPFAIERFTLKDDRGDQHWYGIRVVFFRVWVERYRW